MPELDDIRALVEVVDSGGFALAARRLGVAKSIVSRRITRLEVELGARLLNRTARGASPTEAGAEFCRRATRALAELSEASDFVASRRGEVVGSLRVSLPLSFGLRRMAPIIATLHATYPRLELDLVYSDSSVDILAGRFDVAVRIGRLKDSTLVARRVAPVEFWVVASPEYLRKHPVPTEPQDLANHECLIYSGGRERQTWQFSSGRRRMDVLPRGRLQADNGEGLIQAVEGGLGIAALPDFIVGESLRAGRLTRLFQDYTLQDGAIYLVRPPGKSVPARTRAFMELFAKEFGT